MDEPQTDAALDPWMLAETSGGTVLFGFATRHLFLGGQSWMSSSPVVDLDTAAGTARTASGRYYALGRATSLDALDDEATAAYALLLGKATVPDVEEYRATVRWISSCKMARWLGIAPPKREAAAVTDFIARHADDYRRLRDAKAGPLIRR